MKAKLSTSWAQDSQFLQALRQTINWRTCLEQKDIEAVVICTADHHHAFIANWALNRNVHVFCEKPLGISVERGPCWLPLAGRRFANPQAYETIRSLLIATPKPGPWGRFR
jgi:GFO/IDH/MocA oxidoreductase family protein